MSFEFKVEAASGGPPPGNYKARFEGVDAVPENKEKGYAPAARFSWRVVDGPEEGKLACRTVPLKLTATNVTGKLLAGLVGGALKEGQSINPTDYVGKTYLVVVAKGQGNGTRVEGVVMV